MSNTLNPSIYVASLSDYINGIMHGEWIDAAQDEVCIVEEIQAILSTSPTGCREAATAAGWKEVTTPLYVFSNGNQVAIFPFPSGEGVPWEKLCHHAGVAPPLGAGYEWAAGQEGWEHHENATFFNSSNGAISTVDSWADLCEEQELESTAEEYAVHDSEDMPDMGEWVSYDDISIVGRAVKRNGKAMLAWLNYENCNPSERIRQFDEAYIGSYDSDEEMAEAYLDDVGGLHEVPENLRCYFDVKAYARDMMLNDFFETDGHYFLRNY